ncbi:hypothetical protein TD95_001727 [Thielaviopsis punctulata]|uniref:Large ribosomal subunit protein bL21m n=1 Tax=Thielaviopsis punctulata TaxID=72032 RepID=A0A0F4ZAT0_9PEZI|nr:hypothetical protein TD95_001727 [Thielaviopsis punctulata]
MSRSLFRSVLELRAAVRTVSVRPALAQPLIAQRFASTTAAPTATTTTTTTTTTAAAAAPAKPISDSVRTLLPVLAAQPAHYITVHIHGRSYLVTKGDAVRLPFRMPGSEPGDVLKLTCASVLGSRDLTLKGAPYIDERLYECRAVVVGEEAEPMRVKVKTKRRNRKEKQAKSKHRFTVLRISELKINEVPQ